MPNEDGTGSAADAGNSGDEGSQGTEGTESTTFTSETWREAISSEWAEDASMADFKTMDDLAKSYVHAQKLIGSDERVKIPTEDDTDNWMKFYNKIGRPEEASGYDFKIPEDAPENYENEKFQVAASEFRKTVHDLGLTRTQAEKLWDYNVKQGLNIAQEYNTNHKQQLDGLAEASKKEFGQKLPDVIKMRNNIINQYGDAEVAQFLKDNEIADRSPAVLKMFEKLGKALGEDKIGRQQKTRAVSPKEAKSKVNAITMDKNNPLNEAYHKQYHPRHQEAVDEVNRLWGFYDDDE